MEELASKPFPSSKRASLSEAKLAFFKGDFERCLAICADIGVQSVATASEIALLNARAYLRLHRPREAESVIRETFTLHATLDTSATAHMLLGTARIEQGDYDGGIALLETAAERSVRAHSAIRSEIALATSLGYWAKRDIDTAERYLARVDRNADIIHARALELAAWCQIARGNYRRAAELFIVTLLRLDTCRAHDRGISATAISTLSILGAELFDREFARVARQRASTLDWTSDLVMQHYLTLLHQALFAELTGNTVEAYEFGIRAREIAPSTACQAAAWSVTSIVARNADEAAAAVVCAQRAQNLLATQHARELEGEERLALLAVAESCAHFDSTSAEALLSAYWKLAPIDGTQGIVSGDPCLAAEENFVAGVVAQARGDKTDAARRYRSAFEESKRIGYVRRAALAAFGLVKLTGDGEARNYLVAQFHGTSNYMTRYLARRSTANLPLPEHHPMVATLPQAQREVVLLVCQGKSNKEIAALRHVGEQTIKNMLTKDVFPAFGVSSRAALVSVCLRGNT
jgi:DNA-binding CsgD family transcriptional regulator